MSKWIVDEVGTLVNIDHIEKIYTNSNFKVVEALEYEDQPIDEVTFRQYDIVASTISGKIFFLGKCSINYREMYAEYFILQQLFMTLINSEKQFVDFSTVVYNIKEMSSDKEWIKEIMDAETNSY